ncbi:MAG: M28 family peptidase [Acidobacteriota bacterium]
MTYRGRVALVFGVMVALVGLELDRLHGPAPVPATAPAQTFSASRAIATMKRVLVDAPHPLGTDAHDVVRERIASELRGLGYELKVQHVFACNAAAACGMVDNILASSPGQHAAQSSVIVVAHYDSVGAGPGASDDGTGVATLIEVARATRDEQFTNPIVFLIDDGEEAGLLGAEGFMADTTRSRNAAFVINVEARGTSGSPFLFETSGENRWLIPIVARSLPRPVTTSLFATIYDLLPNDTDLTVFKRAGRAGINFAYLGNGSQYHTPLDNFAHVDARSVQHRGEQVLAMVRAFGVANVRSRTAGNSVWFDVFAFFVAWWPVSWTVWMSIIAAAVTIVATVLRVREREATIPGVALGVVSFAAAVVVAAVAGFAFSWLLGLREKGALFAPHAWVMVAVAWLIGIGAGVAMTALARRRSSFDALFLGHALMWNALALTVALIVPGASYIVVVPALVMSSCALLRAIAEVNEEAVSAVALIGASIVILPFGLVLYDALGGTSLGVIAALLALLATTFAPLLTGIARPLTLGLFTTAVAGAIISALLPAWSPDHPRHLSLAYVMDADAGKARWQTDALTREVRAAGHFPAAKTPVAPWYGAFGVSYVADAPAAAMPPPVATVISDTAHDGRRTVILDVASTRKAPRISLSWHSEAVTEMFTINGVTPPPRPPRFRSFLAPGWNRVTVRGSSARIEIVTQGSAPAEATLTDASFGLPPTGASLAAARDASGAVPVHEGDLTIVERHLKW